MLERAPRPAPARAAPAPRASRTSGSVSSTSNTRCAERRRPVHRPRHLADDLDRRHEHRRVQQERHERPRRQRRACRPAAAAPRTPTPAPSSCARRASAPARTSVHMWWMRLNSAVTSSLRSPKRAISRVLLVERLHHPDAGNRVRQHVRHPRPLAPRPDEQPVDRLAVPVDQPAEQRHRQRHHEAEPPVERQQHRRQARPASRATATRPPRRTPGTPTAGRCRRMTRVIRLPVFLREKNASDSRWMCSYSSARRSRATHSPRIAISRSRTSAARLAHAGTRAPSPPPRPTRSGAARASGSVPCLRRPDHAVDQVAGEVRRHETHQRDDRRRRSCRASAAAGTA